MIPLHRPDGTLFYLNVTHIVTVEVTPDTVITLFGGEKLRVKEDAQTVCDRTNAWFQRFERPAVVTLPPDPRGNCPNDDKED
jgi:flagellar protein FlbD